MSQLFKTNLHFHAKEDPQHKGIKYTLKEGINKAADLHFDVLTITCHKSFMWNKEAAKYATEKGILLISGIEAKIQIQKTRPKKEIIILNCDKEIESVSNIDELRIYKNKHPEIFILAPHPFFYGNFSLKKDLEDNIDLFDAIEHSWFYSKWLNRNKEAGQLAKKYDLPFIATSDTHFFNFFDTDYALINSSEKTPRAIFQAIKQNNFKNITRPKNVLTEMLIPQGFFMMKDFLKKNLRYFD